jgi:hypothetical protein
MRKPTKEQIALVFEATIALGVVALLIAHYFDPPDWFPSLRIW